MIWLTGLAGAGKTTLAGALRERLIATGRRTVVLDGDAMRRGLCSDLGFGAADRAENVRRTAEVAWLMLDVGLSVVVALISPDRAARERVRRLFAQGHFVEVFVDAPLAVVEARDRTGLYRAARRGVLSDVAGLDLPYEPPEHPDVHVQAAQVSVAAAVEMVLAALPADEPLVLKS